MTNLITLVLTVLTGGLMGQQRPRRRFWGAKQVLQSDLPPLVVQVFQALRRRYYDSSQSGRFELDCCWEFPDYLRGRRYVLEGRIVSDDIYGRQRSGQLLEAEVLLVGAVV